VQSVGQLLEGLAYVSRSADGWDFRLFRNGRPRALATPRTTVGRGSASSGTWASDKEPGQWALQLSADGMYIAYLNDLYVDQTGTAALAALAFEGEF